MISEMDAAVARWTSWLASIKAELDAVYADQEMFEGLYRAIIDSGTTSGFWANHYQRLYVSKQTMAMRRIVYGKLGEIAVTRLLADVQRSATDMTIEWYRNRVSNRPSVTSEQVEPFVRWYTTTWCCEAGHLDEGIVYADRSAMGSQVSRVREWADYTVAHLSESARPVALTWGELRGSFDLVARLVNRYEEMINGRTWAFPPIIPGGWPEPFRQKLFE